jgi:hypothetical protein
MIRTLILALALAAGVSSAAQAQQAKVVASCGAQALRLNDGTGQFIDQSGNLCTNAGSAAAPAPSASSNNAITPQTSTGSALVAKASPGNLYGYSFTQGATAGYLALLNAIAAPAASATIAPLECVPVAANSYVRARQDIPDRYSVGIVALSTSSCTTYTVVAPQLIEALVQ